MDAHASVAGEILVVDDNEMNRDMLSRRLTRHGFGVAIAEDGASALRMIGDGGYDLVLLDVMMPGISGLEVLDRIRQTFDGTVLPIIMATARDGTADIVDALKRGANDYVTKPLEFDVVLARTRVQLELKAANDRVRKLACDLERRNAFIRDVFGRYLTHDIADTLLDSPDALAIGGERREISIVMADLRGFSAVASATDPAEVMVLVNHFLATMTDVILRHGGTIDEFIGDAVLALFGAPKGLDDHALRAATCALEMQHAMARVNELNAARGLPAVATGIGVNTGEVIVGNIGSERRAKYGVVGEEVNLASRIQSFAKGGQVLISARTLDACDGQLATAGRIEIRPKGYARDVTVFVLPTR